MSFVCGFNLFKQLRYHSLTRECIEDSLSMTMKLSYIKEIQVLDFSWSGLLFASDDVVKYIGFVNGKDGQSVDIVPPTKDTIVKGRCKQGYVIVITKSKDCWQFNLSHQIWTQLLLRESNSEEGMDQSIIDLATSDNITLLLTNIGQVYSYPSLVSLPNMKVTQVACGFEHSVFLCDNGFIYIWGSGRHGQLGNGDIEDRDEPEELVAMSGIGVVSVAAGGWHTCALTASGDLYAWGWNNHYQLGIPLSDKRLEVVCEPRLVKMPDEEITVKSVSCGSRHTVVLIGDGSVWGCGSNKWCQLGTDGPSTVSKMTLIHKPPREVTVKRVVAALWNTAIICEEHQEPIA